MINKENLKLWDEITFKTISYTKNFDFLLSNEQFITEYDGEISKIRFDEKKPPLLIGEFGISVWNFDLSNLLAIDLKPLLKEYSLDIDSYNEIHDLLINKKLSLESIDKLVIIQHFLIKTEYRKRGISEEFAEFIYRNFYTTKNVMILMLVKPIQNDPMNYDYYFNLRSIKERLMVGDENQYKIIPASKYFNLEEFLEKEDNELNNYKLFSLANKCDFKRISNSHIFEFKPNKIINRIQKKHSKIKELL